MWLKVIKGDIPVGGTVVVDGSHAKPCELVWVSPAYSQILARLNVWWVFLLNNKN